MVKILPFFSFVIAAAKRKRSTESYMKFQRTQARLLVEELLQKGVNLKKGRFLELGCGSGGYSSILLPQTSDFSAADVLEPKELLQKNSHIHFIQFNFERPFPIPSKQYDTIFCASVIEHLKNREAFLRETRRILKDDGILILTFPPFYTPVGGHIFKPFHLFGEKIACTLTSWFKGHTAKSYATAYGDWGFGEWGLYPLKLRDVEILLRNAGFTIKKEWVRYSPINFTKIPFFREFLSWHVHFLCEKSKR